MIYMLTIGSGAHAGKPAGTPIPIPTGLAMDASHGFSQRSFPSTPVTLIGMLEESIPTIRSDQY